ncbi:MAG: hypothetical protein ACI4T5_11450 [Prevotella sp.]
MNLAKINDDIDELFLDKYFPRCSNDVRVISCGMLRCSVWVILSNLIMKGYIKKYGKIEELKRSSFSDGFYILDLGYINKHYIRLDISNPVVRIKDSCCHIRHIIVSWPSEFIDRYQSEVIEVFVTLDTSEKFAPWSIPINITDMEGTNMNIQAIRIDYLDTQSLWQLSEDMIYMALDLVEYFPA